LYVNQLSYTELYDSTKTAAQQIPSKNRFVFKGEFQSSISSEIPLNVMNIPQGAVVVTAGGMRLVEGVDYTVDYAFSRVKILNTGILSSSLKGTLELLSFLRLSGRSNLPPFPCMHYDVTVWLCMHANTAANTSFCAISQAKLVRNDRNRARGDQVNTTADLAGEGRRAGSGTMNSDTLFSW
jgi:hypothetical protein